MSFVSCSASSILLRTRSGSSLREPMKRITDWYFLNSSSSLVRYSTRSFHDETDFRHGALPIFRGKRVGCEGLYPDGISIAHNFAQRFGPIGMTKVLGFPCRLAQRPLPSMIMATWRGIFLRSSSSLAGWVCAEGVDGSGAKKMS